jgi:nucleotide-binding universal stress UspA family protein
MLSALKPTDPAIPARHRLLTGDPAAAIVRVADEEHADMIVMGTHGRTGFLRMIMGSVAEVVVRKAACPVLTIKQPADQEAPANV